MPLASGEANSEINASSCYHQVITCQVPKAPDEILDSRHAQPGSLSCAITRARLSLYTRLNEVAGMPKSRKKARSLINHPVEDCVGKEEDFLTTDYGPPSITRTSATSRIHPWRRSNVYRLQNKRIASYRGRRMSYDRSTPDQILSNHLYANVKLGYACPPTEQTNENSDSRHVTLNNVADSMDIETGTNHTIDVECPRQSTNKDCDIVRTCPGARQSDEPKDGSVNRETIGTSAELGKIDSHPLRSNDNETFSAVTELKDQVDEQLNGQSVEVNSTNSECQNPQLDDVALQTVTAGVDETAVIGSIAYCVSEIVETMLQSICANGEFQDADYSGCGVDSASATQPNLSSNAKDSNSTSSSAASKHHDKVQLKDVANESSSVTSNGGGENDCISKIVSEMIQSICGCRLAANGNEGYNGFENVAIATLCKPCNLSNDTSVSDSASLPTWINHSQNDLFEATSNNNDSGMEKGRVNNAVDNMVKSMNDSMLATNVGKKYNSVDNGSVSAAATQSISLVNATDYESCRAGNNSRLERTLNGSVNCIDKMNCISEEMPQDIAGECSNSQANEISEGGVAQCKPCSAAYCYDHPHCEDCKQNRTDKESIDLDHNRSMETNNMPKWQDSFGLHVGVDDSRKVSAPSISIGRSEEPDEIQLMDYQNINDQFRAPKDNTLNLNKDGRHVDSDHSESEQADLAESIQTELGVGEMITVEEGSSTGGNTSSDSLQRELNVQQPDSQGEEEDVSSTSTEESGCSDVETSLSSPQGLGLGDIFQKNEALHERELCIPSISSDNNLDMEQSLSDEYMQHFDSCLKKDDLVSKTVTDVLSVFLKGHANQKTPQCDESKQPDSELTTFKTDLTKLQNFTSQNSLSTTSRPSETCHTEFCVPSDSVPFQLISTKTTFSNSHMQKHTTKAQQPKCHDADNMAKPTFSHNLPSTIQLSRRNDQEPKKELLKVQRHGAIKIIQRPGKSGSDTKIFVKKAQQGKATVFFLKSTGALKPMRGTCVASVAVPPKLCPSLQSRTKLATVTVHSNLTTKNSCKEGSIPAVSDRSCDNKANKSVLAPGLSPSSHSRTKTSSTVAQHKILTTSTLFKALRTPGVTDSTSKANQAVLVPTLCSTSMTTTNGKVDVPVLTKSVANTNHGKTDLVADTPSLCFSSRTTMSKDNYNPTADIIPRVHSPLCKSDGRLSTMYNPTSQSSGNSNTNAELQTPDLQPASVSENSVENSMSESLPQSKQESEEKVVLVSPNHFDKHCIDEVDSFSKQLLDLDDLDCSKCTKCVSCNHNSSDYVPDKMSQPPMHEKEDDQKDVEMHEEFSELPTTEVPQQNEFMPQKLVCSSEASDKPTSHSDEPQNVVKMEPPEKVCDGFVSDKNAMTCHIDDPVTFDTSGLELLDGCLSLANEANQVKSPTKDSKIHTEDEVIKIDSTTHQDDVCPADNAVVESGKEMTCEKQDVGSSNTVPDLDKIEVVSSCVEIASKSPAETSQTYIEDGSLKESDQDNVAASRNVADTVGPTDVSNSEDANLHESKLTAVSLQTGSGEIQQAEFQSPVICREGGASGNVDNDVSGDTDLADAKLDHDQHQESCHDEKTKSDEANETETDVNICATSNGSYLDVHQYITQPGKSELQVGFVESTVTKNQPADTVENMNVIKCSIKEIDKGNNENTDETQASRLDFEKECVVNDDTTMENFVDDAKDNNNIESGGENDIIPHCGENLVANFTHPMAHIEEATPCKGIGVSLLAKDLEITEIPEISESNFTCANDLGGNNSQVKDIPTSESKKSPLNGSELSDMSNECNIMQQQDLLREATLGLSHITHISKTIDFPFIEELVTPLESNFDTGKTIEFHEIDADVPVICEVDNVQNADCTNHDLFNLKSSVEDVLKPIECYAHLINSEGNLPVPISTCEQAVQREENFNEVSSIIGLSGDIEHQKKSVLSVGCDRKFCEDHNMTKSIPNTDLEKHAISVDTVSCGIDHSTDKSNTKDESTSLAFGETPTKTTQPTVEDSIQQMTCSVSSDKNFLSKHIRDNMTPTLQLKDIRSNKEFWMSNEGITCNIKACNLCVDDSSQVSNEEEGLNEVFQNLPKAMVEEAHACVKPIVDMLCGREMCQFVKRSNMPKPATLLIPRKRTKSQVKTLNVTDSDGVKSGEKGCKDKRKRTFSLSSIDKDHEKPAPKKRGRPRKYPEIITQSPSPIISRSDATENICPNITPGSLILPRLNCNLSSKSPKNSCLHTLYSVRERGYPNCSVSDKKMPTLTSSNTYSTTGQITPVSTVVSNAYWSQVLSSLASVSARSSAVNGTNSKSTSIKKIPSHLEPMLTPSAPKFLDQDDKLQQRTRVSLTPMEHIRTLPTFSADIGFDLKRNDNDVENTGTQFKVGKQEMEFHNDELSSLHANNSTGITSNFIPEIHEVTTGMTSSVLGSRKSKEVFYSNAMMGVQKADNSPGLFSKSKNLHEPYPMSTCHLHSSTQNYSSPYALSLCSQSVNVVTKKSCTESEETVSQSDSLISQLHCVISEIQPANKTSSVRKPRKICRPSSSRYYRDRHGHFKKRRANPDWSVLQPVSQSKQSLGSEGVTMIHSKTPTSSDRPKTSELSGNCFSCEGPSGIRNLVIDANTQRQIRSEFVRLGARLVKTEASGTSPSQQAVENSTSHHVSIPDTIATSFSKPIARSTEQRLIKNGKMPTAATATVDRRKSAKKRSKRSNERSNNRARPPKQENVLADFVPAPSKSQDMLNDISCQDLGVEHQRKEEYTINVNSRKHDHTELPISALDDRDQRELFKHNGKSFVQDAPCFDIAKMYGVETSGPQFGDQSWRKCRECRSIRRRDSASVFCRFYGFRKLQFKDNLLCTAGFLQPDECSAKDLQLWLPQKNCFRQPCPDMKNVVSPADPFETRVADFIMSNIGKRFCEIALIENKAKSWINSDECIYWKKPVPGVRDLCDVCETTLFNIHWICPKCGYGVCLDCFDRRRRKSNQEQKIYDSKSSNGFRWGRCVKGQNHIHSSMVPTQIIPSTCLEDLNEMIHDICKKRNIKTLCRCQKKAKKKFLKKSKVCSNETNDSSKKQRSLDDNDTSADRVRKRRSSEGSLNSTTQVRPKLAKRSSSLQDEVKHSKSPLPSIESIDLPKSDDDGKSTNSSEDGRSELPSIEARLQWLCGGRLLQLTDSQHPGNLEIFKIHWKRGIPVVVSGVGKYLDMNLWHPIRLSHEYGEEESKNSLINCLTGSIVTNMKIKDFWDGFENISRRLCDEDNKTMILKLKDWPPTEAFHDVMPEMFEDLMRALPLPEYTFIGGICNLASRLPQFFVKPDLGPKMYNAYGWVTETNWKQGTTNLHLDISDAVNVMVYVGIPHDEPKEAKERLLQIVDEGDVDEIQRMRAIREKPGALWHIFHEKDVNKIRKFIKSVWMECGEVDAADHDPIHDQQMYLDRGLRRRLKEEYGVEGCGIVQCEGDGVFIPAGAPHQVFNLHSCIKIAEDFVSPEHVDKCFNLTNEFRYLSSTHSNHEDKLQIKNIIYHAVKDIASSAIHTHCLQR